MEWVTRERPKIDRIACPWLILRFIDAQAQFRYDDVSLVIRNRNGLSPQRCAVASASQCCSASPRKSSR